MRRNQIVNKNSSKPVTRDRSLTYVCVYTLSEEAESFGDAGRLGNLRKNDQECIYSGTVFEVQLDDASYAGNVTTDDTTCGLPRTHGGLGTETASAEHCRLKCLNEVRRIFLSIYSQFPFNVYKVSVPPFVSLRVRAKFHSGRKSKHEGMETL